MKSVKTKKELSQEQREELVGELEARFEDHLGRHPELQGDQIFNRAIRCVDG